MVTGSYVPFANIRPKPSSVRFAAVAVIRTSTAEVCDAHESGRLTTGTYQ